MSTEIQPEQQLSAQELQEQEEALKLKNEEILKSFTPEKTKDLIEETGELLTIDNAEKKEIIKNLGDKAPNFLAEINSLDNEFKEKMKLKNNDINTLTELDYKEQEKLYIELMNFINKHEALFKKIDENDGNAIDTLIESTKFNEEKHEVSWDNLDALFDASKDGLSNGLLLGMKKYENLFSGGVDGIIKLAGSISDMVEKMGVGEFLGMIGESIYNDFKKMLDFSQPTYKIAQSIGKFLIDIIMQLISGGIGMAGKLATIINKLVPNGLIKKGLNSAVKTGDEFLKAFTGIKPELLSKEGVKSLGLSGTGSAVGNELMYYAGVSQYMVLREGSKLTLKGIEAFQKRGFTIDKINPVQYLTPDGRTIVKLMKYEEKIELKTIENGLRYLTGIQKKEIIPNLSKLQEIAHLTGTTGKWANRINNLKNEEKLNNFPKTEVFKEMFSTLNSKYSKEKKNYT